MSDATPEPPRAAATRLPVRSPALALLLLAGAAALLTAGPNRYGHSDRVERHMLPAVSTGPMDPEWSPDGRWIAFSMRGDVWKLPAEGGVAVQLTEGPAYHFEPTWSPDGSRIALSFDRGDGNLDVGVVSADGGAVVRLTTDAEVDVQPEWSADGRRVYFTSARAGGFRVFAVEAPGPGDAGGGATGGTADPGSASTGSAASPRVVEIVRGLQPAVSPDGGRLAYVAPVRGRMGSGGIWTVPLDPGTGAAAAEPTLVHYEEAEYRTRPAWTPDGRALLYVSDTPGRAGSNDVAILPAEGGNPVVLTPDTMHEHSPAPSPDGARFAFVSNHEGPTTLYTVDAGGGPRSAWRRVPIEGFRTRVPHGTLRVRVVDAEGSPVPSRIHLTAADGRSYAPDGGFHRVISVSETHYFHADGSAEVRLPAGRTEVEVVRGFEYRPARTAVEVPADGTAEVELVLERLVDAPARGWWSGDTHLHDLHQGRFGLDHERYMLQLLAEDVHVAHTLIHMDGTRLMGRWGDLTGRPHPLSTPTHVLQYGQEYRGSLGHVALLGVSEYVLPFIGGAGATAYDQPELDLRWLDGARQQGGIAGFVHPFLNRVEEPGDASRSLIALDAALGRGDFYDIGAVYSDEWASTEMYYRLLNAGLRLPATAGTDNFSDVWRDPPPGTTRTYVHLEGPPSVEAWMEGVRAMRTFGTTGPLLFVEVEGLLPGGEVRLGAGAAEEVAVRAEVVSVAPLDSLEIVVNGRVAAAVAPTPMASAGEGAGQRYGGRAGHRAVFEGRVAVPRGGWVAARAWGPPSRWVADSYAFAQTTPVWVVRDGVEWRSPDEARFLAASVEALWDGVQGGPWRTPEERDRFRAAVEEAVAFYRDVADEASSGDPAAR